MNATHPPTEKAEPIQTDPAEIALMELLKLLALSDHSKVPPHEYEVTLLLIHDALQEVPGSSFSVELRLRRAMKRMHLARLMVEKLRNSLVKRMRQNGVKV